MDIVSRFHPGVNRCYCPSQEVAKRALLDGLEDSQIRVFGLPIRPTFARAVLSKVRCMSEIMFVCRVQCAWLLNLLNGALSPPLILGCIGSTQRRT